MTVYRLAARAAVAIAAVIAFFPGEALAAKPPACPDQGHKYPPGGPPLSEGPTNDPLYGSQWGHVQLSTPEAWRRGIRGDGAVIAIIDSGVDLNHPDLLPNLVEGRNFFNGERADCPQDNTGHGTHVAGIAAARGDNGIGISGVAPRAQIMPLRVGGKVGADIVVDPAAIAQAIRYAADHGAAVANISIAADPKLQGILGGAEFTETQALIDAAVEYAWSKGTLIVAAAGNGTSQATLGAYCSYPAAHPRVLCVGSTDRRGLPLSSNLTNKDLLDGAAVRAPGGAGLEYKTIMGATDGCGSGAEGIMSTWWPGATDTAICGTAYDVYSGSSMASPAAAGVVALLAGCGLTAQQTIDRILATATNGGRFDPVMGYGIVDAGTATDGLPCRTPPASAAPPQAAENKPAPNSESKPRKRTEKKSAKRRKGKRCKKRRGAARSDRHRRSAKCARHKKTKRSRRTASSMSTAFA